MISSSVLIYYRVEKSPEILHLVAPINIFEKFVVRQMLYDNIISSLLLIWTVDTRGWAGCVGGNLHVHN